MAINNDTKALVASQLASAYIKRDKSDITLEPKDYAKIFALMYQEVSKVIIRAEYPEPTAEESAQYKELLESY